MCFGRRLPLRPIFLNNDKNEAFLSSFAHSIPAEEQTTGKGGGKFEHSNINLNI